MVEESFLEIYSKILRKSHFGVKMKRFKYKIITLVFISLVLFVSFIPLLPILPINMNNANNEVSNNLPNDDFLGVSAGAGSEMMDPYTGSGGSGITIMEDGIQSASSSSILPNSTDNVSISVNDQNWDGTMINASVSSLQETGQWIQNENFDGETNWVEHNEVGGAHVGDDYVNEHNSTMTHTADGSGSREIVLIGESGELPNDIRLDQRNGEINQFTGDTWNPDFYNWTELMDGSVEMNAIDDALYVHEYTKGNTSIGSTYLAQTIDL